MKQPLRIGDVIEVKAKDRRYSSTDYKIKITEITSRMAKGREIEKDGTLSLFGMNHRFNLNMEDLNVQGMLKNHKLAKAIQEVGFYRFKSILLDKSINNGKRVVFIDRFYPSSKTCHNCEYVNKELTLNDREWICPQCGEYHDRDINAAMNILIEGERILKSSA